MCVCCPALRSRSRQPVKRYKKLLAEIFPKSPDGSANDRKIAKLCEYAAKNPFCIPKVITSSLLHFLALTLSLLLPHHHLLDSWATAFPIHVFQLIATLSEVLLHWVSSHHLVHGAL